MDMNVWDVKASKYIQEHKVKSIYNSTLGYVKLTYNDNTEKRFNTSEYRLEFVYSDAWKKEAY